MTHRSEEGGAFLERQPEPECLYPFVDGAGNFTFRFGSPGERYYLFGQAIHAGDLLEMQLNDGAWTRVRYEWNPKAGQARPILCFEDQRAIALSEEARFRWPRTPKKE